MERRFTFKDFFLFTFLTVLLIMIVTAMYMIDRQWTKLAQIQQTMEEQAADIRGLRGAATLPGQGLPSGAVSTAPADTAATTTAAAGGGDQGPVPAAFRRAYDASKMAGYQSGDWLVQAFGVSLKTITPLVSTDAYAAEVQGYIQASLLTRDPVTLEWLGLIAERWQVSADGLTFTFQLRKGVKFSDGKDLTADDVAFTFAFIMNPAINAPRERAYYDKIAAVTALDPYQVVFKFKEPYYDSLALAGGMAIMPRHFYEPYLKTPETYNKSKGLLLGSGPYRLKDPKGWTPDLGMVELERNPRYWGAVQPPFNRLLWKVIANDAARLTTFRNGEIDTYGARPREYKTLLADKDFMKNVQRFEYMSPVAGYNYIAWNQQRGGKPTRFADKRVRQAMTYVTDRQRAIDEIMLGYGEVAVSPFSPRSKQHDKSLTAHPYDLAKAKQLLQEAGYSDRNGDGILDDAEGRPFEFELVFFQDNEDTRRVVLFLKDLYARAGIKLIPKPTEWSVMIDRIKQRDFDAITLGWTSGIETDIYQIFHSSQIADGGDDFISYKNPKLDQLIEKARATVDEKARMPLWQEAERILSEDQPYTFLMRRQSLVFIDKRIRNLQITNVGLNLGMVPVEVFVPGAEQKYRK